MIISSGQSRLRIMMTRYKYMPHWSGFIIPDLIKVTYTFKMLTGNDSPAPGYIQLKGGDEIQFGNGKAEDIKKLGRGPLPVLCNLQYAVACVLHMSGAADIIAKWKDDADCLDFPHVYITSTDFANILVAKLFLNSG
jgi:hypothetical protein